MGNKTKVNIVICSSCGEGIYSVSRHDYHRCSCGNTTIDGGFDYLRYGWKSGCTPTALLKCYVNATKQELYNDYAWNLRTPRKFGTISKADIQKRLKRRKNV